MKYLVLMKRVLPGGIRERDWHVADSEDAAKLCVKAMRGAAAASKWPHVIEVEDARIFEVKEIEL